MGDDESTGPNQEIGNAVHANKKLPDDGAAALG
jgi:hypothetical protein